MTAQTINFLANLPPRLLPWKESQDFQLEQLLTKMAKRGCPTELVEQAYRLAEKSHTNQYRMSGEPYITHPLAVAQMLNDFECTEATIAAALLHDVLEDTDTSEKDIIEECGKEVAEIVDGVTKLDKINFKTKEEADTASLSKMLKAANLDLRVLFVKLADRLHNMSTLSALPEKRQKVIASETLKFYAPMASRLGMQELSRQLEDLAFATLHSKWFAEIDQMVESHSPERELYLSQIETQVEEALLTEDIVNKVFIRPKHLWSIYQKMESGKEFRDIYDLMGIRIVVESVSDCYSALGVIHSMWQHLPGRFKDHIAVPKFNLYQSLHTTVMGPSTKLLEIQIRTAEMDDRAEKGIAAHWAYKEAGHSDVKWLERMVDWVEEASNAKESIEMNYPDIEEEEISVFTPKRDLISLPLGSTPIDFAYALHSDLGNRTRGAKVNGNSVKLSTPLYSGDTVEISTAESSEPLKEWLEFVITPKARNTIKRWHFPTGDKTDNSEDANKDIDGELDDTTQDFESSTSATIGILVEGQGDVHVRLSACCHPNRANDILGFVTKGKGVSVHTSDCENVAFLSTTEPERFINVEWDSWQCPTEFVNIEVRALDRSGLLRDILSVMPANVFIGNMSSNKVSGGAANIKFELEINDEAQSKAVIKNIRKVDSVYDVVVT